MDLAQLDQGILGKRKREDDDDYDSDDGLFVTQDSIITDVDKMVPRDGGQDLDDEQLDPRDQSLLDIYDSGDEKDGRDDDDETDGRGDGDEEGERPLEERYTAQLVHDESLEAFPRCAIYDNNIPAITIGLRDILNQVQLILAQHECNSKRVVTQRTKASALLRVPTTTKLRIALVGPAGTGKSSFLNSITDTMDLAKSLGAGESCTCVPTEYSGAFPRQKQNFIARITYFESNRMSQMLQEMLEDYCLWTFERDKDWDEDTRTTNKKSSQNAFKTFRSLFCDLEQFSSIQSGEDFLRSCYVGKVSALPVFVESCEKKLKDKITADHGYSEYHEASTRGQLREIVDPLMCSTSKYDKPALWPLVKQVCIGMRGSRVLDRITFVDLPGVSDTNQMRVNVSKEYIKSCDHLWIIAPIARVIDDNTVYHLLTRYASWFKGNVLVICTHADTGVDSKLATHLKGEEHDVELYYELGEELRVQRKLITDKNALIKREERKKKNTKARLLDLPNERDHLDGLTAEWHDINQRRFEFLVRARNAKVIHDLQHEFQDNLPQGQELRVHCISNTHYASLKGAGSLSGPRLSADASGIPGLRAYALSLAAPGLLRTLEIFIHDVQVFLRDLALWTNTTTVERRTELLALVKQPQEELYKRIPRRCNAFEQTLDSKISHALRAKQNDAIESAIKVLANKRSKHPLTIRAFVRKYGNHCTKVCPKECWNEQFMKLITDLVRSQWVELENLAVRLTDSLKQNLMADLKTVVNALNSRPESVVLPMKRLNDVVKAQMNGIKNIFIDDQASYEKDLRNILIDTTQDSPANSFTHGIKPVYETCKADSGAGVVKRNLEALESHISTTGHRAPFAVMERTLTRALADNDKKHVSTRVRPKIQRIFQQVYDSFDHLIDDDAVDDPAEASVRKAVGLALKHINKEFEKVGEHLEAVKASYAT